MLLIGTPPPSPPRLYPNPIKVALQYKEMLDKAGSQAEVARNLGVSRAKVTQMLNLLKLDREIQEFILGLDEKDERLKALTEHRLREVVQIGDIDEQLKRFGEMVCTGKAGVA